MKRICSRMSKCIPERVDSPLDELFSPEKQTKSRESCFPLPRRMREKDRGVSIVSTSQIYVRAQKH